MGSRLDLNRVGYRLNAVYHVKPARTSGANGRKHVSTPRRYAVQTNGSASVRTRPFVSIASSICSGSVNMAGIKRGVA